MKRKIVPIQPELLYKLLTVGSPVYYQCEEGLPKRARFVSHGYDVLRDMHYLVFESDEWEDVPLGTMLPELVCRFRSFHVVSLLTRAEEMIEKTRPHGMEKWLEEWRTIKDRLIR